MARSQLESLAGRDLLDAPGTLDLAEVRWRTGDLQGAGVAAAAYLAANGGDALGFIIAAEAATLAGRQAEARREMEQALLRTLTSLDSVYRGIERKSLFTATAWATTPVPDKARAKTPEASAPAVEQVGAGQPAPKQVTAAETAAEVATDTDAGASVAAIEPEPAAGSAVSDPAASVPSEPAISAELEPATEVPLRAPAAVVDPNRINAATEISAGTALLEEGDSLMAALHFGIALRMTGDAAPAVLAAIGERHDPPLELVRGDALRVMGLESDAGAAYLSVATALSAARNVAQSPALPAAEAAVEPPAAETQAVAVAEAPAEPATEAHAAEPAAEPAAEAPASEPLVAASPVDSVPATSAETAESAPEATPNGISAPASEAPEEPPRKPQPAVLPPITWSD
jgi:hypothetical protein